MKAEGIHKKKTRPDYLKKKNAKQNFSAWSQITWEGNLDTLEWRTPEMANM